MTNVCHNHYVMLRRAAATVQAILGQAEKNRYVGASRAPIVAAPPGYLFPKHAVSGRLRHLKDAPRELSSGTVGEQNKNVDHPYEHPTPSLERLKRIIGVCLQPRPSNAVTAFSSNLHGLAEDHDAPVVPTADRLDLLLRERLVRQSFGGVVVHPLLDGTVSTIEARAPKESGSRYNTLRLSCRGFGGWVVAGLQCAGQIRFARF